MNREFQTPNLLVEAGKLVWNAYLPSTASRRETVLTLLADTPFMVALADSARNALMSSPDPASGLLAPASLALMLRIFYSNLRHNIEPIT